MSEANFLTMHTKMDQRTSRFLLFIMAIRKEFFNLFFWSSSLYSPMPVFQKLPLKSQILREFGHLIHVDILVAEHQKSTAMLLVSDSGKSGKSKER